MTGRCDTRHTGVPGSVPPGRYGIRRTSPASSDRSRCCCRRDIPGNRKRGSPSDARAWYRPGGKRCRSTPAGGARCDMPCTPPSLRSSSNRCDRSCRTGRRRRAGHDRSPRLRERWCLPEPRCRPRDIGRSSSPPIASGGSRCRQPGLRVSCLRAAPSARDRTCRRDSPARGAERAKTVCRSRFPTGSRFPCDTGGRGCPRGRTQAPGPLRCRSNRRSESTLRPTR